MLFIPALLAWVTATRASKTIMMADFIFKWLTRCMRSLLWLQKYQCLEAVKNTAILLVCKHFVWYSNMPTTETKRTHCLKSQWAFGWHININRWRNAKYRHKTLHGKCARMVYLFTSFWRIKKFNLRVVETHVFYRLCFNRHLKRILYKRGWKNPYLVSSKIKRRPTSATSTTPRTRLTDPHNSDNFHKQYYNHITPTCHDKSHLDQ